jgi:hypothetical protein
MISKSIILFWPSGFLIGLIYLLQIAEFSPSNKTLAVLSPIIAMLCIITSFIFMNFGQRAKIAILLKRLEVLLPYIATIVFPAISGSILLLFIGVEEVHKHSAICNYMVISLITQSFWAAILFLWSIKNKNS